MNHAEVQPVTVFEGDCLTVLSMLPADSIDAVVTDPPYGISFMGKQWDQPDQYGSQRRGGSERPFTAGPVGVDHLTTTERSASMHAGKYDLSLTAMQSFQAWCTAWAVECLRVLKPGGHLLAFGGTRTWHRLAVAVEDAGFEVRDSIAWLYGSGFPKSMDVSKAIDKAAGATREVIGTKVKHGGATPTPGNHNNDGPIRDVWRDSRPVEAYEVPITTPATPEADQWQGWGTALKPAFEPIVVARKPFRGTVAANVLEHGTGALNIDGCRIGDELITAHGGGPSGDHRIYNGDKINGQGIPPQERGSNPRVGRWPANVILDEDQAAALDEQSGTSTSSSRPRKNAALNGSVYAAQTERVTGGHDDSGGASRFFYVAKAPKKERPTVDGVAHPTVKPLTLMRWLTRLVTPPGGFVLDPFAGSGTTGEAAVLEGFKAILIEREPDYLQLIRARIDRLPKAEEAAS